MEFILQNLATGLSIGSILLLTALGLAIIYGSMGVINMAHGEFVMLGAYITWALGTIFGMGLLSSLVIVFFGVGLLGYLVERGVIRFLYRRPLDTILATWGIGVMLQQIVRIIAGGELRYVEMPSALSGTVSVFGASIAGYRVFIFFLVLALFAATWLLMYRTKFGAQLRAVMQNHEMASCFGVNSSQVYGLTFAYGAGLAGIAGALVAPLKSVSPEMGTSYVIDAFFVVVLGGVQSLFGTVASAFLLGEATATLGYIWNDTIAKAIVLLGIMILIRFRPQGLFVSKVRG